MNILTFDIEEWFHILDNDSTKSEKEWNSFEYRLDANMDRIFKVLTDTNQQATFFCLGWVAREFPHVIKKITDQGYEIATHSDRHQLVYEQTPKEFKEDLIISLKYLEDITSSKIRAYRAPGFSVTEHNQWVFEELIAAGIEIDCSVFPAERSHGGFKTFGEEIPSVIKTQSGVLKEFPINTIPILGKRAIFSGGGFFRLLPYWIVNHFMKKSPYVMTYFHPRDFDPDQPMINGLSAIRKFKSYYGLKYAESKLRRLLSDYSFMSLQEANLAVDWDKAPSIMIESIE